MTMTAEELNSLRESTVAGLQQTFAVTLLFQRQLVHVTSDLSSRMSTIESRMNRIEARLDGIDARQSAVDARLSAVEASNQIIIDHLGNLEQLNRNAIGFATRDS